MESDISNNKREETPRGFLKLPPKSRSPSQGRIGRSPSRATDAACCSKSPESGSSSGVPNKSNASSDAEHESNSQR